MLVLTISCILPFSMTCSICLKSLPKTIVFPPNVIVQLNGLLNLNKFLIVLSKASKQYLYIIGVSSQIIKLYFIISSAKSLPWDMLQVESLIRFIRMTNLKCVVLPPDIRASLSRSFFAVF